VIPRQIYPPKKFLHSQGFQIYFVYCWIDYLVNATLMFKNRNILQATISFFDDFLWTTTNSNCKHRKARKTPLKKTARKMLLKLTPYLI